MNTIFLVSWLLLSNLSDPVATPAEKTPDSKTITIAPNELAIKGKGYWVIQQCTEIKEKVLICYYNDSNELVKREWRKAAEIEMSKPKVVRSLQKALKEAIKMQEEENWN